MLNNRIECARKIRLDGMYGIKMQANGNQTPKLRDYYSKHEKHINLKFLILFCAQLLLCVSKTTFVCEAAEFKPASNSLLDQLSHLHEEEDKRYNKFTPVFPNEDDRISNIESQNDGIGVGMLLCKTKFYLFLRVEQISMNH